MIVVEPFKEYNFTLPGAKKDLKSDGTFEKITLKNVELEKVKSIVSFEKGLNIYESIGEIKIHVQDT